MLDLVYTTCITIWLFIYNYPKTVRITDTSYLFLYSERQIKDNIFFKKLAFAH